jgi:hypothetical protein
LFLAGSFYFGVDSALLPNIVRQVRSHLGFHPRLHKEQYGGRQQKHDAEHAYQELRSQVFHGLQDF